MSFIDRISGQSSDQLPEAIHFGRWIFVTSDRPTYVNGCPVRNGDVLAPGGAEDWVITRPGQNTSIYGRFFADAHPDTQSTQALNEFLSSDGSKITWRNWSKISPLAPGLDEPVRPHVLVDQIEAEFVHLEKVCRDPRTHIRRETERLPLARVRRVARDATVRLVSHTEDWERRTISGIRPRRVLADTRRERWDIYENRVAVQLVDNLIAWLRQRIEEIRRIQIDVYDRMERIRGSVTGTRHRAHRIYALWGEGWDDSLVTSAEATRNRLEELYYRLLSLTDSQLYRRIPRTARIPHELRATNLFGNDDHYRGVARLWHRWSRETATIAASRSDLWARDQDLHRCFDAWCMLLVVHACSQLRLVPPEDEYLDSEIHPGNSIPLCRGFSVKWESTGAILFADTLAGRDLIRFVPLIHGLESAKTPHAAETRVNPLIEAVNGTTVWTVVLHHAKSGKPTHEFLAGVGNPPLPHAVGGIDFIRVSPYSLDSVERVTRAIRWMVLVPRMLAYPPTVRAIPPSTLAEVSNHDTVREFHMADRLRFPPRGTSWAIDRSIPDSSVRSLKQCVDKARTRRERLVRNREEFRGQPSKKSDRSALNREISTLDNLIGLLDRFLNEAQEASGNLSALAECPACGTTVTEFIPRDQDCFAARCRSKGCEARWGLHPRPNSASGTSDTGQTMINRIPVFLPGDEVPDEWPRDSAPQWVDDILGCDVLSIPVRRDDGSVEFLPPRTVSRPT